MMGVNANQEDMFSKLEEMRSVINEVNNQFKNPVSIKKGRNLIKGKEGLLIFLFYYDLIRVSLRLSVCVSLNSCRYMKRNV